jgi:hypothetical protein
VRDEEEEVVSDRRGIDERRRPETAGRRTESILPAVAHCP